MYLDAGFWFRKQICSAGISAVWPQLTVHLSVFWTSNFLNFISHLSHSARLFSIGTESEESGKQHNHFCRYLFQLELRWWLYISFPIILYSGKSIYILSGTHWEIINNEHWSYSNKKNHYCKLWTRIGQRCRDCSSNYDGFLSKIFLPKLKLSKPQ